jgi:hypothetical protein
MDNLPHLVGSLLPILIFGCLPAYFLDRAFRSGTRSELLANLALACGLSVVVIGELAFSAGESNWSLRMRIGGVIRASLALTGLALAIAAFFARKDGGVGVTRPILGGLFSTLHLFVAGLMLLSTLALDPGTPWEFAAPDDAFHFTFPSTSWKQMPPAHGDRFVTFANRLRPMRLNIIAVGTNKTSEDLDKVVNRFREQITSKPQVYTEPNFSEGTNAAGHPYRFVTLIEPKSSGGSVFVAHCATLNVESGAMVELLLEGQMRMRSIAGKGLELDKMKKESEAICLSVK